jgi:hypothetical protein
LYRSTFKTYLLKLIETLTSIFSSPEPVTSPSSGFDVFSLASALLVFSWLFAYQIKCFLGLGTTSDLYIFEQLSKTWLQGRFFVDNCYGSVLAIHTYFLVPILALFTVPLGAIGLLLASSLAAAMGMLAMKKIAELLLVPAPIALIWALIATAMPLSIQVYQDRIYGFHLEILEPAMALWLTYFLLRRNACGTTVLALMLFSTKEDVPLLVAAVCASVFCEDFLRGLRPLQSTPSGLRSRGVNYLALAGFVAAAVILPTLLYFLKLHYVPGSSQANFRRMKLSEDGNVSGYGSLLYYVISNLGDWLYANGTLEWLALCLAGTFWLIYLRPHFLAFGVVTTLTAWIMQDGSGLWAPRLAPGVGIFQISGSIALGSAYYWYGRAASWSRSRIFLPLIALSGALFLLSEGFKYQIQTLPLVREVYTLNPELKIGAGDRAKADALFAIYRKLGKASEPAIASPLLFRYAHDRNLFWFDRLEGRPRPVWILWDYGEPDPVPKLALYDCLGKNGRFALYHLR